MQKVTEVEVEVEVEVEEVVTESEEEREEATCSVKPALGSLNKVLDQLVSREQVGISDLMFFPPTHGLSHMSAHRGIVPKQPCSCTEK